MNPRGPAGSGRPRATRRAIPVLVVLLAAAFAVAPAHADAQPGHVHHESTAMPPGILLLAAVGTVLVIPGPRGRRVGILALALLVGWFGLQSAVHSVHHFLDPQSAASCPLFLASQHADGAGASPGIVEAPTWTPQPTPAFDDQRIRPLRDFRPHEGRAPPVLPSV